MNRRPQAVAAGLRLQILSNFKGRLSAVIAQVAALAMLAQPGNAQELGWGYRQYKIRALIALDLPGDVEERVAIELPAYLRRRAEATMGQIWSVDIEFAIAAARQQILSRLSTSQEPLADLPLAGTDKVVLISILWQAGEYTLAAREFDTYVQRWSSPVIRRTQQAESLLEQTFAILSQCVSPLAQVEPDADDENRVILKPRGAALARPISGELWTSPGEVFVPIVLRTTRGGEAIEGAIQDIPWTYLEVTELKGTGAHARIHSGMRRPFAVRRQGRVEQLAIALRGDPSDITLRLHSRTTGDKPLVGYEVFAEKPGKKNSGIDRIGLTDRNGKVIVPPGNSRVRVLFLKNGGQVLARLPVVPGARPQLDVPLPDDDARLAAETRLAALREELVDVVARRNILMARARQKIEKKDFAGAQELVSKINELPGRSQFNLEMQAAARRFRSDDPQIQRRIDRLFEGTQNALAQFLDTRPINELTNELRAAQQTGT
jgi:hypothetical protein